MPKPQSVPAMTRSRPTIAGEANDALSDQRRMFDVIGRGVDHARQQHLVLWKLDVLPNRPLVGMARISGFKHQALNLCAKHDLDDLAEIDVVGMRPLIVAPADVHAHHVRRHLGERVIEHLDVECGALEKLGFAQILKAGVP